MSDKFPVNEQNSAAFTKRKLLKDDQESKRYCSCSRPYRLFVFLIIICCTFLIYWIILTPVLINHPRDRSKTDSFFTYGWFILYWSIAFVVWLLIMLCLIFVWKCFDNRYNDNIKLQSYGTNDSLKSVSSIDTKANNSQNVKPKDIERNVECSKDVRLDEDKSVRDKNDTNVSHESQAHKIKTHKDLPPLIVHRRNLGNDIECDGIVNIKQNDNRNSEDGNALKSGFDDNQKDQRESMKSYLKLVTVTPNDETDTKTPRDSLSPRELFFIDLIKGAEKAEKDRMNDNPPITERRRFFPNDFSPTEKNRPNDLSGHKNLPGTSMSNRSPKASSLNKSPEATYFIADVESPKSEKNEVFLEIAPDLEPVKQWNVDLNKEKPVLTLKQNIKNEENENTDNKIVLFEV